MSAYVLGAVANFLCPQERQFDFANTDEPNGIYNSTSDDPTGVNSGVFMHFRTSKTSFYHRVIICFNTTDIDKPEVYIRLFRSSWGNWIKVPLPKFYGSEGMSEGMPANYGLYISTKYSQYGFDFYISLATGNIPDILWIRTNFSSTTSAWAKVPLTT